MQRLFLATATILVLHGQVEAQIVQEVPHAGGTIRVNVPTPVGPAPGDAVAEVQGIGAGVVGTIVARNPTHAVVNLEVDPRSALGVGRVLLRRPRDGGQLGDTVGMLTVDLRWPRIPLDTRVTARGPGQQSERDSLMVPRDVGWVPYILVLRSSADVFRLSDSLAIDHPGVRVTSPFPDLDGAAPAPLALYAIAVNRDSIQRLGLVLVRIVNAQRSNGLTTSIPLRSEAVPSISSAEGAVAPGAVTLTIRGRDFDPGATVQAAQDGGAFEEWAVESGTARNVLQTRGTIASSTNRLRVRVVNPNGTPSAAFSLVVDHAIRGLNLVGAQVPVRLYPRQSFDLSLQPSGVTPADLASYVSSGRLRVRISGEGWTQVSNVPQNGIVSVSLVAPDTVGSAPRTLERKLGLEIGVVDDGVVKTRWHINDALALQFPPLITDSASVGRRPFRPGQSAVVTIRGAHFRNDVDVEGPAIDSISRTTTAITLHVRADSAWTTNDTLRYAIIQDARRYPAGRVTLDPWPQLSRLLTIVAGDDTLPFGSQQVLDAGREESIRLRVNGGALESGVVLVEVSAFRDSAMTVPLMRTKPVLVRSDGETQTITLVSSLESAGLDIGDPLYLHAEVKGAPIPASEAALKTDYDGFIDRLRLVAGLMARRMAVEEHRPDTIAREGDQTLEDMYLGLEIAIAKDFGVGAGLIFLGPGGGNANDEPARWAVGPSLRYRWLTLALGVETDPDRRFIAGEGFREDSDNDMYLMLGASIGEEVTDFLGAVGGGGD